MSYTLEIYRVISGKQQWIAVGQFSTIAETLMAITRFWALDYRIKLEDGRTYPIEFKDDEDGIFTLPYLRQEKIGVVISR